MSAEEKHKQIEALFAPCKSKEETYKKIMELGKELPKLSSDKRTPENLVSGCQSTMYLHSTYQDGLMHFTAYSDALISAGLAALLIRAYDKEPPESLFKNPPHFLNSLKITTSLTPGRANGLYSLYKKMQQEASRFI